MASEKQGVRLISGGPINGVRTDPVRAIRQVEEILQNVVEHLQNAEGGAADLTLEINAASLGFDDRIQRVVRENAAQLNASAQEFE